MKETNNNSIFCISLLFCILFGIICLPFWKPIVIAGIFALALQPFLSYSPKTNLISPKLVIMAVVLTTLLIITPFILGSYFLISKLVEFSKKENNLEIVNLNISEKFSDILIHFGVSKNLALNSIFDKMNTKISDSVLEYSSGIIQNIPIFFLNLMIFILFLYVILTYQSFLKSAIYRYKILSPIHLKELIKVLSNGSHQCLVALLIVGTIQSFIILTGALIANFPEPILIFLITFICSFIPIIGTGPIGVFLSSWEFFHGNIGMGIFLLIIAIIAGISDNILTPLFIKRGIHIDGTIALIAIIGGISLFGLAGLLIGPIIGTTCAYYFNKYNKIQ